MYELRRSGPEGSDSESLYEIVEQDTGRSVGTAKVRWGAPPVDVAPSEEGATIELSYIISAHKKEALPDIVAFVLRERPRIWVRAAGEWIAKR